MDMNAWDVYLVTQMCSLHYSRLEKRDAGELSSLLLGIVSPWVKLVEVPAAGVECAKVYTV